MDGQDVVIHLAALKQLPRGELHPTEFTKTNTLGAENVVKAACKKNVRRLLFVSSDKAVLPPSHYGSTKLSGEKLMVQYSSRYPDIAMSILRPGNVWGSRGSISQLLMSEKMDDLLAITDTNNTRFSISPEEVAKSIVFALKYGQRSEVFIPKMRAYLLKDLLEAADIIEFQLVGLRSGERSHEVIMSKQEMKRALETGQGFYILPNQEVTPNNSDLWSDLSLNKVDESEAFDSQNAARISVDELRELLRKPAKRFVNE